MRLLTRITVTTSMILCTGFATAQESVYVATIREQINQGLITQSQGEQQIRAAELKTQLAQTPKNKLTKFEITRADTSLQDLLTRWGAEQGWEIIINDLPKIRINGEAELIRPDYLAAADFVITQARSLGHMIKAEAFSNNVLVLSGEKSK